MSLLLMTVSSEEALHLSSVSLLGLLLVKDCERTRFGFAKQRVQARPE